MPPGWPTRGCRSPGCWAELRPGFRAGTVGRATRGAGRPVREPAVPSGEPAVPSGEPAVPGGKGIRATVMLSRPPASMANRTSALAEPSGSVCAAGMASPASPAASGW